MRVNCRAVKRGGGGSSLHADSPYQDQFHWPSELEGWQKKHGMERKSVILEPLDFSDRVQHAR